MVDVQPIDAVSILNGRIKRLSGFSYPLSPNSRQFGLDFSISEEDDEVNESEMSFVLPFASGVRRDGVGDLLEIGGIDTSRHIKSPIILFDHGKTIPLPIGLTETRDTREYTVKIDPISQTAKSKVFLYQGRGLSGISKERDYDHSIFVQQLFDLWCKRLVRAGSLGYTVIQAKHLSPDYTKGIPAGLHLIKTLMLEASVVVLPANQDTVSKRKSFEEDSIRRILSMPKIAGYAPSPYLVKSLQPYVTDTSVTVGFSDLQAVRDKYKFKAKEIDSKKTLDYLTKSTPVVKPSAKVKTKAINVRYKQKVIKGFAEVNLKFDMSSLDVDKQNNFIAEMESCGFGRPKQGRWGGEKARLQSPLKVATFCFDVEPESDKNNAVAEAIRTASEVAHRYGVRYLGNLGSKSLFGYATKTQSEFANKPCPKNVRSDLTGCIPRDEQSQQEGGRERGESELDPEGKPISSQSSQPSLPKGYKLVSEPKWTTQGVPEKAILEAVEEYGDVQANHVEEILRDLDIKREDTRELLEYLVEDKYLSYNEEDDSFTLGGGPTGEHPEVADAILHYIEEQDEADAVTAIEAGREGDLDLSRHEIGGVLDHLADTGKLIIAENPDGDVVYRIPFQSSEKSLTLKDNNVFSNKFVAFARNKSMPVKHKAEAIISANNTSLGKDMNTQEINMSEPYGAQFLRQLHDDHGVLMRHYDSLLGPLEPDSAIRKYAIARLQRVEQDLSEMEKLFKKHYKELPGLAGEDDKEMVEDDTPAEEVGGETKDLTKEELDDAVENLEEEAEDTEEDAREEAEEFDVIEDDVEKEEMDTMDDAAIGGDSDDREEEAPEPEEVAEAMKTKGLYKPLNKRMKSLRNKYRIKTQKKENRKGPLCKLGQTPREVGCRRNPKWHTGAYVDKGICSVCGKSECACPDSVKTKDHPCDKCGKDPCICDVEHAVGYTPKESLTEETEKEAKLGKKEGKVAPLVAGAIGYGLSQLLGKNYGTVKEGSQFLNDVSQENSEWTEDHRHKSYHYGRTFEGICSLDEVHEDLEKTPPESDIPPAKQNPGVGAVGNKALPSESTDVTPEKAKKILKDGMVHGKPLTEKQRGFFGAIAGKGKDMSSLNNGSGSALVKGPKVGSEEWRKEEELEHAKKKGIGGALVGGALGAAVGGPGGASIGANLGSAVGDMISGDDNKSMCKSSFCKRCKGASEHFHELARTPELSSEHRQKSANWHKEIEAALQEDEEDKSSEEDTEETDKETPAFEPGEMGEKTLDMIRGATVRQDRVMDELIKQIDGISQRVGLGIFPV